MDKAKVIFKNEISEKDYRKAVKIKEKYIKKFGDDSNVNYKLNDIDNSIIGPCFGVRNLEISDKEDVSFDKQSLVIGNIRMGFGHYRISMAMASAAHALGYTPYWFDLNSLEGTVCSKVIRHQNELYSLGSRMSQKSKLFNIYWEKLNSEGFRKLSYNAADQKNAELMATVCRAFPKEMPFLATHVWPAQAAVAAGMTNVVNAIPDNWPMALHLAEGSKHTVQTPSSYLGYKALRGMSKEPLKPMPADSIYCTGHYIDHELVTNIEKDCAARLDRIKNGKALRYLMTVGGAGAGKDLFVRMIKKMIPEIKSGKAALFINFGDHKNVYDEIKAEIAGLEAITIEHFNDYTETKEFANKMLKGDASGIHVFCSEDIFAAVYSTNLLMRCSDVLVTKPSELAFYPIPKLMIKRVGGHEAWGAIRAAEVGDGTYECDTLPEIISMLNLMQNDGSVIEGMCKNILTANKAGIYNGAYNAVKLACGIRI